MIHSRPSSCHSRKGSGQIREQRYKFYRKNAFGNLGFRLQRNLKKLILPSILSTRIRCQCTVSLVFIFRVVNILFIHTPCQPPKKNYLRTSQASQHTVQLQLRNPALVLDPAPGSGCGAGCSAGRGPACVGESVAVYPGFPRVRFAGTRTRVPVGERAREGRPLAGANSPQTSRVPSWREPTRAGQPSKRTPTTPPKSGHAQAWDPLSAPRNLCFCEPHTQGSGIRGVSGGKRGAPTPPLCRGPQRQPALSALLGPATRPAQIFATNSLSLPALQWRSAHPLPQGAAPAETPNLVTTPAAPRHSAGVPHSPTQSARRLLVLHLSRGKPSGLGGLGAGRAVSTSSLPPPHLL